MIEALVSDFSQVVLFPADPAYEGSLNQLFAQHRADTGFDFFTYFQLNLELLTFYRQLKTRIPLYLFTSDTIQEAPELQPFIGSLFDQVFSAKKMGLTKKDSQAYTLIAQTLNVPPEEVIFVDDDLTNIQAAQKARYQTLHFQGNQSLINSPVLRF